VPGWHVCPALGSAEPAWCSGRRLRAYLGARAREPSVRLLALARTARGARRRPDVGVYGSGQGG
jgi:hypothetical protein